MGMAPEFTEELLQEHREELDENKYEHTLSADHPEAVETLALLREYYKP